MATPTSGGCRRSRRSTSNRATAHELQRRSARRPDLRDLVREVRVIRWLAPRGAGRAPARDRRALAKRGRPAPAGRLNDGRRVHPRLASSARRRQPAERDRTCCKRSWRRNRRLARREPQRENDGRARSYTGYLPMWGGERVKFAFVCAEQVSREADNERDTGALAGNAKLRTGERSSSKHWGTTRALARGRRGGPFRAL